MNTYDGAEIVNIGTGEDLTIRELTEMVALTVGYQGEIRWDPTKPDGTPASSSTSHACTPSAGGTGTRCTRV